MPAAIPFIQAVVTAVGGYVATAQIVIAVAPTIGSGRQLARPVEVAQ